MTLIASKILVVDDEPEMLALLNEWLEDDGYVHQQESDGPDTEQHREHPAKPLGRVTQHRRVP